MHAAKRRLWGLAIGTPALAIAVGVGWDFFTQIELRERYSQARAAGFAMSRSELEVPKWPASEDAGVVYERFFLENRAFARELELVFRSSDNTAQLAQLASRWSDQLKPLCRTTNLPRCELIRPLGSPFDRKIRLLTVAVAKIAEVLAVRRAKQGHIEESIEWLTLYRRITRQLLCQYWDSNNLSEYSHHPLISVASVVRGRPEFLLRLAGFAGSDPGVDQLITDDFSFVHEHICRRYASHSRWMYNPSPLSPKWFVNNISVVRRRAESIEIERHLKAHSTLNNASLTLEQKQAIIDSLAPVTHPLLSDEFAAPSVIRHRIRYARQQVIAAQAIEMLLAEAEKRPSTTMRNRYGAPLETLLTKDRLVVICRAQEEDLGLEIAKDTVGIRTDFGRL